MAKSLSSLFHEADELINAKLASGVAARNAAPVEEDDVFKLANEVRRSGAVKEASEGVTVDEQLTVLEKVAHARAIDDTLINLPTILKIDQFEKNAKARGYSDEQIAAYLEKNAEQFPLRTILQG